MPFTSGTFALYSTGNPIVSGTTISSTWGNNTLNDLASGLTTCVLKDGTQTMTANIPMAGFKFTNIGVGSATTDSVSLAQVQNGFGSFLTAVSGTNTVVGTATPTPSYTVGQRFTFVPAVTNTGATTLNISSVGAGAVQLDGGALIGGELEAGTPVTVYVSATTPVFEIVTAGLPRGTTSTTFTFDGSGGSTGTLVLTWQKSGNFVTLNIPAALATTGTGSTALSSNTALAAGVRPVAQQTFPINEIRNNGAAISSPGNIIINTDGTVGIVRDAALLAFTNTAQAGLNIATTVTYFIA